MTASKKRNGKPPKTRRVEYYRLWGGDSGTWDTDFIEIPADTPDGRLDMAIRKVAGKIKWRNDVPVIVGYYCDTDDENDNEDDVSSIEQIPPAMAPEDRDQAIENLLAKAEAAGLEAEDVDEMVYELAASIAADVNNSGLDGQLGYLLDQLGSEGTSKQLDRLAEKRRESTD